MKDSSKIPSCCLQLDIGDPGWLGALREHVENWPSVYRTAQESYKVIADEFERLRGFPHDKFEYLAITDRLS
jgi:hypothetical protein